MQASCSTPPTQPARGTGAFDRGPGTIFLGLFNGCTRSNFALPSSPFLTRVVARLPAKSSALAYSWPECSWPCQSLRRSQLPQLAQTLLVFCSERRALLWSPWPFDALASAVQCCAPGPRLWGSFSHGSWPDSHPCVPLFHGRPLRSEPPAPSRVPVGPYQMGWPRLCLPARIGPQMPVVCQPPNIY